MNIENIPNGDVYNGDFEEKPEKRLYTCFGTLEIGIYTYDRILEAIGLDKLELDHEEITIKVKLEESIEAWDQWQADSMWHNIIEHKEDNINEMFTHSGVRGSVTHIAEDCKVLRKPKK